MESATPQKAGRRASSLSLFFIVAIAAVSGAYFGSAAKVVSNCNSELQSRAGSPSGICLQAISLDYSEPNSSLVGVPVLLMQPGTNASVSILYEPHADQGSAYNPQSELTAANIPTAVSAATGEANQTAVAFSKGILVFQHDNWTMYRYNITASADSAGYYAIAVPFGPMLYPALVITSNPESLNLSEMSLWGYDGNIKTGETIIPSIFVGTSNLSIANVTVPEFQLCRTRACNVMASSEYYQQ